MEKEQYIILGNPSSKYLFIQLVDEHDMELMDNEAGMLQKLVGHTDWCIAAVPVDDWNRDLTPWKARPVFGKQGFGDGAAQTLDRLIHRIIPAIAQEHPVPARQYILCGYSLAGLFALWAAYQTDRFAGVVAASPSVWYRDWLTYAGEHAIRVPKVYLSLGDREEKAKNPIMASVGTAIREQHRMLEEAGVRCQLDWNPGNHFADSDRRMARGMAWMYGVLSCKMPRKSTKTHIGSI